MGLNGSLLNLRSALGGAVRGALLALGGVGALSLGLPLYTAAVGLLARPRPPRRLRRGGESARPSTGRVRPTEDAKPAGAVTIRDRTRARAAPLPAS